MRIIEKLTTKFKNPKPQVITTRNLIEPMLKERIMFVPNYNEREYIKSRKRTQRQVRKTLEK